MAEGLAAALARARLAAKEQYRRDLQAARERHDEAVRVAEAEYERRRKERA